VRAINSVGTAPISNVRSATTLKELGPVVDLAYGTVTATSIPLTWTAPAEDIRAPISDYEIRYTVDGVDHATVSKGSTTTGFTIGGGFGTPTSSALPHGANVTNIDVRAVNLVGTAVKSNVVGTATLKVPSPVTTLVVRQVTAATVVLNWTAPVQDPRAPITAYELRYTYNDVAVLVVLATPTPSFVVGSGAGLPPSTPLTAGTTVSGVDVRAVNLVGVATKGNVVNTTTVTSPKPVNLTTGAITPDTIAISWTPNVDDLRAPVTHYEIRYTVDGVVHSVIVADAPLSSFIIGGSPGSEPLPDGAVVTDIDIRPVNRVGPGKSSTPMPGDPAADPQGLITLQIAPSVTNLATGNVTSSTVPLSWSTPIQDPRAPITGYVIRYTLNGVPKTVTVSGQPTNFLIGGGTGSPASTPLPAGAVVSQIDIRPINSVGQSLVSNVVQTTTLGVPPPITTLAVAAVTPTTVVLTWQPPLFDLRAPILNHEIRYAVNGVPRSTLLSGLGSTGFTVTDLPLGADVTNIEVRAINVVGTASTPSNLAGTVTLNVPPVVMVLTGKPTATTIPLTWIAPIQDLRAPITNYQVRYTVDGMEYAAVLTGSPSTNFTIGGGGGQPASAPMPHGANVTNINVRAVNRVGVAAMSNLVAETTLKEVAAITDLSEASVAPTSLTLRWTPPPQDPRAPIANYRVRYYVGFLPATVVLSSGTAPNFTITGLSPGDVVSVDVRAINLVGPAPISNVVATSTLKVPPPITDLAVSSLLPDRITLSWIPLAEDPRAPITGYQVEYHVAGEPGTKTIFVSAPTAGFTIPGLEPGAVLSINVQAVNSVGEANPSNIVDATSILPGMEATPTAIALAEGNTTLFSVVLLAPPTKNVTIWATLVPETARVSLARDHVVFTPSNWELPQVLLVRAEQDAIALGPRHTKVELFTNSTDQFFEGLTASVGISVGDDDFADVKMACGAVSPCALESKVMEGSIGAGYTIVLTSQPTQEVTIETSAGLGLLAMHPASVSFRPFDWFVPRTVWVTAPRNFVDRGGEENGLIKHKIVTTAAEFAGLLVPDIEVDVIDVDAVAVGVSGGAIDDVVETVDNMLRAAFAGEPWNSQVVFVRHSEDVVSLTDSIAALTGSLDAEQVLEDLLSAHPELRVFVQNIDRQGEMDSFASRRGARKILLALPVFELSGDEGAVVGVYSVRLASMPQGVVSVTILPETGVTAGPSVLWFNASNWTKPRLVTVAADLNKIDEGAPAVVLVHHSIAATSVDSLFQSVLVPSVTVTIAEDDSVGVSVSSPPNIDVREGGPALTYSVKLLSEPRGQVIVKPSFDPSQVTVSPTEFVFDSTNWMVGQAITISATDDQIADGAHSQKISFDITSPDSLYNLLSVRQIAVRITDNDEAGFIVAPVSQLGPQSSLELLSLTVIEGSDDTTFYTIRLASQPTDSVTIDVGSTGPSADASPSSLLFTNLDWAIPQVVTLRGVSDGVALGYRCEFTTHTVSTGDSVYAKLPFPNQAVAVIDDTGIVKVSAWSRTMTVFESGDSDTFHVSIGSRPTHPVTIRMTFPPGIVVSPEFITIPSTPDAWAKPLPVVVSATQDFTVHGTRDMGISFTVESEGTAYNSGPMLVVDDALVTVVDDDYASVTLSSTRLSAVEGGATATYRMKLTSLPQHEVTVTLSSVGLVDVAPKSIIFDNEVSWRDGLLVTVTAVDDLINQGEHMARVTAVVSSTDTFYDGQGVPDVDVTITDNDVAGLVLSTATVAVIEGGASDAFYVALKSEPRAPVTISLSVDSAVTVSPTVLSFNASSWSIGQLVTVTAIDDAVDEDPETVTIAVLAASLDTFYNKLPVLEVSVSVESNDVAGVILEPAAVALLEGTTSPASLRLFSQPTSPVTITLTPNMDLVVSVGTLVFTPENWNISQTVQLSRENDIAEGTVTAKVTFALTGLDLKYTAPGAVTVPNLPVTVTDDDTAGVSISATNITITEGGTAATYTVRVNTQPLVPVTVTIEDLAGSGLIINGASFTFDNTNWRSETTVSVSMGQDSLAQGTRSPRVTHSVKSSGVFYCCVEIAPVKVWVLDDDRVGVKVSNSQMALVEGGASGSYSISLASMPFDTVTIKVNVSAGLRAQPSTFDIEPSKWDKQHTVTVEALQDDRVQDVRLLTVSHVVESIADSAYNGIFAAPVNVSVLSEDKAGILIAPLSLRLEEGSSGYVSIRLLSEPAAPVKVALSVGTQVRVEPSEVTLQPGTWSRPIPVFVTALENAVQDGSRTVRLSPSVTSTDADYNKLLNVPAPTVTITDNDQAGVTVSTRSARIAEAEEAVTVVVTLASEPVGPVTVTVGVTGPITARFPTTAVLTPDNWNMGVSVLVTAVQDNSQTGDRHATLMVSLGSLDPLYNNASVPSVNVLVVDDDVAGVRLGQFERDRSDDVVDDIDQRQVIVEGGQPVAVYVSLDTKPLAPVTLFLEAGWRVKVSPPNLTITPGNWMQSIPVLVSVPETDGVEGPLIVPVSLRALSTDSFYSGRSASKSYDVQDNDEASIGVSHTDLDAMEGGSAVVYAIVLGKRPVQPVKVTVTSQSPRVLVEPPFVILKPASWQTPHNVLVYASDDHVVGGASGKLLHSAESDDLFFDNIAVAPVNVHILDNDTAAVDVDKTFVDLLEGDDEGQIILWTLRSQPQSPVTLTFKRNYQLHAVPDFIVLDSSNWNTGVPVRVHAVDNSKASGQLLTLLRTVVTTADKHYEELAAPVVVFRISDNDGAIYLTPAAGVTVVEGGPQVGYYVVLGSIPTSAVDIAMTTPSGLMAIPRVLHFTPQSWNISQLVVTSVRSDFRANSIHAEKVSHAVSSGDIAYNGLAVQDMKVTIVDDDTPGLLISTDSIALMEGLQGVTYLIKLNSEPIDPVRVSMTVQGLAQAAPAHLVFEGEESWRVGLMVTVTAVDDLINQGPHAAVVRHSVVSDDDLYNEIAVTHVNVAITDNDVAGLVLSETTLYVTEGQDGAGYFVALNSEPRHDVHVSVSASNQVRLSPQVLTFTAGNWNVSQRVIATAFDDDVAELDEVVVITHSTVSTDYFYDILEPVTVDATVTSDDVAGVEVMVSSVTLSEGSNGAIGVRLTSQPIADVRMSAISSNGVVVNVTNAAPLVFGPANWDTVQYLTVSGGADEVAQGARKVTVTPVLLNSTLDPNYLPSAGLSILTVRVTVEDDDVASLSFIAEDPISVTEGGASWPLVMRLGSEPMGPMSVVVTLRPADLPLAVVPANGTVLPSQWRGDIALSIVPGNDTVAAGSRKVLMCVKAVSTVDAIYDDLPAVCRQLTLHDDRSAALVLDETALVLAEGSDTSYGVKLSSKPGSDVIVTLSSSNPQMTLRPSPSVLTFTSDNWDAKQTVTAAFLNDNVANSSITEMIVHSISSRDSFYEALRNVPLPVRVTDSDAPGVLVSIAAVTVEEGSSVMYTVRLMSQPPSASVVTITPSCADPEVRPFSPLVFTQSNWNVPQNVTVSVLQNDRADGPRHHLLSHSVSTLDPHYKTLPIDDVDISVTDNDAAGFVVTPEFAHVSENGTVGTFTVSLNSEPFAPVTFTPDIGDSVVELHFAPDTITFTKLNWKNSQSVNVSVLNDISETVPVAVRVTMGVTASTDNAYKSLAPKAVTVYKHDDDTAAVVLTPILADDGLFSTKELGRACSYTIALATKPIADVTALVVFGSELEASPRAVTFSPANWSDPQTVSLMAVDNAVVDGVRAVEVTHTMSSTDPFYQKLVVRSLPVTIEDNDVAGVLVSRQSLSLREGLAPVPYNARLLSQPIHPVSIVPLPGMGLRVSPAELVFTATTWNQLQTIYVDAINDFEMQGTRITTIVHDVTSLDLHYQNMTIFNVLATVYDDDIALVSVNETDITVGEGGQACFAVTLDSQPTQNVNITVLCGCASLQMEPRSTVITPALWNTSNTVKVNAVNDDIPEGPRRVPISLRVRSQDDNYENIEAPTVRALILDDDGLLIVTPQDVYVREGAAPGKYTLVLASQPTGPVTVDILTAEGVTPLPPQVTFSELTWNKPMPVYVMADDNESIDGMRGVSLRHAMSSKDVAYKSKFGANVTVHIVDDDVPGMIVAPPFLEVQEGGRAVRYAVQLTTRPREDVHMTIERFTLGSSDHALVITPSIVVFKANDDWSESKIIKVDMPRDYLPADHSVQTLRHVLVSDDPRYNTADGSFRNPPSVEVSVHDIDEPGLIVSPLSLQVTEGGPPTTYTVRLLSKTLTTLNVRATTEMTQVEVSPAVLQFTPELWNVPQTVTIRAVDDSVAEGFQTVLVEHAISGGDVEYRGLTMPSVSVSITDNDEEGAQVLGMTVMSVEVLEGRGHHAWYTFTLKSQPIREVMVNISFARNDTGAELSQYNYLIAPRDWQARQTVFCGAFDDNIADGTRTVQLIHTITSADPYYNKGQAPNVQIVIRDNDTPGFVLSEQSIVVVKGGAPETFMMNLKSEPRKRVIVRLEIQTTRGAVTTIASASPVEYTFTPTNYNVPQVVTMRAPKWALGNGIVNVKFIFGGEDQVYLGLTEPVFPVFLTAPGGASVAVSMAAISLIEGSTRGVTFTVHLGSVPSGNVTVSMSAGSPELLLSTTSLVFFPHNFNVPQNVTCLGRENNVVESVVTAITYTIKTTDVEYASLAVKPTTVIIFDNDKPELVSSASSLRADEGTKNNFVTLSITTMPKGNIVLGLDLVPAIVGVRLSPSSFILNSSNWDKRHKFEVITTDDDIFLGDRSASAHVTVKSSTQDQDYSSLFTSVHIHVADNDVAGVVVSNKTLAVAEGMNVTQSYTVKLTSHPRETVTVQFIHSQQVALSSATLSFTEENWSKPQVVAVAAVDDAVVEGPHKATVKHEVDSSDVFYRGIQVPSVDVSITDNDRAGIDISVIALEVAEGAPGTFYTVVLKSQPKAIVRLQVRSSEYRQVIVEPERLAFSAADWNVKQRVNVTAVDDLLSENLHSTQLQHLIATSDSDYALNIPDVTVVIQDNDFAGLKLQLRDVEVGTPDRRLLAALADVEEGGVPLSYTVALKSMPSAPVTIVIDQTGMIDLSPKTLLFAPYAWNIPQSVHVLAIDDPTPNGNTNAEIGHKAASSDLLWSSLRPKNLTIGVLDNDDYPVPNDVNVYLEEDDIGHFILNGTHPTSTLIGFITKLPETGDLYQIGATSPIRTTPTLVTDKAMRLTYQPAPDANGLPLTSAEYIVRDRDLNPSQFAGKIFFFVNPVNDPPAAVTYVHRMHHFSDDVNSTLELPLADSDGDKLLFVPIELPAVGVLMAFPRPGARAVDIAPPAVARSQRSEVASEALSLRVMEPEPVKLDTVYDLNEYMIKYVPPDGASGLPFSDFKYLLSDGRLNSSISQITLNVGCAEGFKHNPREKTCLPCPLGQFSPFADSTACTDCRPGLYAAKPGSVYCELCGPQMFQSEPGSTECQSCPVNTISTLGASAITDCRCEIGFYGPNGGPCKQCPEHSVCDKVGQILPIPMPGFWMDPNFPGDLVECRPPEACLPYTGNGTGGCAPGYFGRGCSKCSPHDYYRMNVGCEPCGDHSAWVWILVCIAMILLPVPLLFFVSRVEFAYTGLQILFNFCQALAVIRTFSVVWPSRIDELLRIMTVFNLNFQFWRPECWISGWGYPWQWGLTLLLPVLYTFLFGLLYGCTRLIALRRYRKREQQKKEIKNKWRQEKLRYSQDRQEQELFALLGPDTRDDDRDLSDNVIRAWLLFFTLGYMLLAASSLGWFTCVFNRGDGSYSLQEDPSTQCYTTDGVWIKLVPFAFCGVGLYVVGVPSVFWGLLKGNSIAVRLHRIDTCFYCTHNEHAKLGDVARTNMLKHHRVNESMGSFYNVYEYPFRWFEIVVCVRKLLLICVQFFFVVLPLQQLLLANMVLLASFAIQMFLRPFLHGGMDRLESICLFTEYFLVFFALFFVAEGVQDSFVETLEIIQAIWIPIVLICGALYTFLDILTLSSKMTIDKAAKNDARKTGSTDDLLKGQRVTLKKLVTRAKDFIFRQHGVGTADEQAAYLQARRVLKKDGLRDFRRLMQQCNEKELAKFKSTLDSYAQFEDIVEQRMLLDKTVSELLNGFLLPGSSMRVLQWLSFKANRGEQADFKHLMLRLFELRAMDLKTEEKVLQDASGGRRLLLKAGSALSMNQMQAPQPPKGMKASPANMMQRQQTQMFLDQALRYIVSPVGPGSPSSPFSKVAGRAGKPQHLGEGGTVLDWQQQADELELDEDLHQGWNVDVDPALAYRGPQELSDDLGLVDDSDDLGEIDLRDLSGGCSGDPPMSAVTADVGAELGMDGVEGEEVQNLYASLRLNTLPSPSPVVEVKDQWASSPKPPTALAHPPRRPEQTAEWQDLQRVQGSGRTPTPQYDAQGRPTGLPPRPASTGAAAPPELTESSLVLSPVTPSYGMEWK